LLLVIRLPALLANSPGGAVVAGASPSGVTATYVMLSFVLTHVALVVYVLRRARKAARLLNSPSISGADVSHGMDHLLGWSRWATIGITGVHLFLGMPAIVNGWLSHTVLLGKLPLFAEAIYFAPPFLSWVAFWAANYEVEAVNRERSFPYRLAQGLPTHPMPSMSHYLSMQIRHNFYLLVLIGIASLIEFAGDRLDGVVPYAGGIASVLALASVLLMVPWLITRIWTTVPLRGPLRHRLDAIASEYHIRFRNILIWKTHNQITNAAILGPVRFARYFLMTDALLEQLTDQQIESVFAHEIGHGVHRHILWYLAGMFGAMGLAGGLGTIFQFYSPDAVKTLVTTYVGPVDAGAMIFMMGLLALFLSFGFSFVSHRFEHQADWFAARHMSKVIAAKPNSLPMPALALTEATDPAEFSASIVDIQPLPPMVTIEEYVAGAYPHARADVEGKVTPGPNIENAPAIRAFLPPAVAGTEVFISSLDALVELSHRSRDKRGWMHPSINHRVKLLRKLATDPVEAAAFKRRMVTTRVIIAIVIAAGAAMAIVGWRIEERMAEKTQQVEPEAPTRGGGSLQWI
jgi:Zn-dependent protease with chaperone function